MNLRFKRSLKAEFVVLVIAVIVFVIAIFSYFFISMYKSSLMQSLQLDTKKQAYRLADSVVSSIPLGRNGILQRYVDNVIRESDIICVEVYDKDFDRLTNSQVVSKEGESFLDSRKMSENADVLFEKQKSIEHFYKYKGKIRAFEFISPVVSYEQGNVNGEVIGSVRVIASLKNIDEKLAKTIKTIVSLAVYVLIISSLLSVMVIRMFLEPINKLVSVTKQISKGNLSSKVPKFKTVELRMLALAVNVMSRHLKKILDVLRNEKESLLYAKKSLEVKNQSIKELISKEQQFHVELIKEERFGTIRKLATCLAHEIKNPLAGIINSMYVISKKEGYKNDKDTMEMGCIVTNNAKKIDNILIELLDYSERNDVKRTQIYVDELINKSIGSMCLPNNIRLKMDLKHIAALIDKESFEQIVRHLLKNAVDAMPHGGEISIAIGKLDNKLELKIKDTGRGIAPEEIKNIYDPFYSRKVTGMGLGLAIVKEIVELHNGVIFVSSEIERGTEFSIYIPDISES
ncbi:MAG: HAMP domain-containing protein [Endomicrobium sp.]|jgi:signal transduction histidine kinase|nr:HAMP domain-containing protein [Endomicrobium sp.]